MLHGYAGMANALSTTPSHLYRRLTQLRDKYTSVFGNSRICLSSPRRNLNVGPAAYGRGGTVGGGRGVGVVLGVGDAIGVAVAVGVGDAIGVAVAVGVGLAPPPWKLNFPMRVCQLKLPVVAWYSFACQKSMPLDGSIVVML